MSHHSLPASSEAFVQCPNCGFEIPIGATFCEGCNAGRSEVPKDPGLGSRSVAQHRRVPTEFPSEYDTHPFLSFLKVCFVIVSVFVFLVIAYFATWFVAGGGSFD